MGIDRLRKYGLFPIEAFAVISEESMIPLCEKYGIEYCFYKNLPVGEKLNYGLSEAFKKEWDYFIQVGSDDLLKNEYLEMVKENLGWDVITIDNFAYLNSEDGECRMYSNKSTFGIGRMISRAAIGACSVLPKRLNLVAVFNTRRAPFFVSFQPNIRPDNSRPNF